MPFDSGTMRFVPAQRGKLGRATSRPVENDAYDDLIKVLPTLTVEEIVELVEAGEADLDDVIAAEKVGKARKTVLALVKGDSGKVYPVFGKPDTQ
jgi:hypothetical protein